MCAERIKPSPQFRSWRTNVFQPQMPYYGKSSALNLAPHPPLERCFTKVELSKHPIEKDGNGVIVSYSRQNGKRVVAISASRVPETEADGLRRSRRYWITTPRKAAMSIPLREKLAAVAIVSQFFVCRSPLLHPRATDQSNEKAGWDEQVYQLVEVVSCSIIPFP